MRRPVGRDLSATHSPNFFGVTLEEDIEEPFAELIAHPVLEIAWIAHRPEPGFEPGENAQKRPKNAELHQRFERLEGISEELAAVEDSRRPWSLQHVVGQNLRPEIFHRLGFGEKPVSANVKVKTLVGGRSGDPADVNRVQFQDGHIELVLGKQIRRRQSGWPGANNRDICFHCFLGHPISPRKIPDIPTLHA